MEDFEVIACQHTGGNWFIVPIGGKCPECKQRDDVAEGFYRLAEMYKKSFEMMYECEKRKLDEADEAFWRNR